MIKLINELRDNFDGSFEVLAVKRLLPEHADEINKLCTSKFSEEMLYEIKEMLKKDTYFMVEAINEDDNHAWALFLYDFDKDEWDYTLYMSEEFLEPATLEFFVEEINDK